MPLTSPELALQVLRCAGIGLAVVDSRRPGLPFAAVNEAFADLAGAPGDRTLLDMLAPSPVLDELAAALTGGRAWAGVVQLGERPRHAELHACPLDDGGRMAVILRDVQHDIDVAKRLALVEGRYGRVLDDLTAAELRYRELVERIPAVVYIAEHREGWPLRYISPQIEALSGHPPSAFLADDQLRHRLVHDGDRQRVLEAETRALTGGGALDIEYRLRAADGTLRWVSERDEVVRDADGRPLFTQGVLIDITAQREAEERVREERDRAQRYLDMTRMLVLVLDPGGRIEMLNRAGHELLGRADGTLIGCDWFDTCVASEERAALRARFAHIAEGRRAPGNEGVETPLVTADGDVRIVSWTASVLRDGDGRGDVGAQLGRRRDRAPPRRAPDRAPRLPRPADRPAQPRAPARASRPRARSRPPQPDGGRAAVPRPRRLQDRQRLARPWRRRRHPVPRRRPAAPAPAGERPAGPSRRRRVPAAAARSSARGRRRGGPRRDRGDPRRSPSRSRSPAPSSSLGASVGISLYPDDAQDAETLLRHADAAMYQAKAGGRSEVTVYADDTSPLLERLSLSSLRQAIAGGDFAALAADRGPAWRRVFVAVEALVRWQHPERGCSRRITSLPFAEETGLIDRLGTWVADAVGAQRAAWRARGLDPGVHINVSARQLARRGFAADLVDRVGAGGLTVELAEGALRGDGAAERTVRDLAGRGVRVAVCGFGAGGCAPGSLRRLPVHTAKVDRSLLEGVPGAPGAAALVQAVRGVADALGLDAVAEGVETEAQRAFLAERGWTAAQGHLFGAPAPAEALSALPRRAGVADG
ncbi:MAG: EAL domain-containing protein [Solirubrobacterales bacterium]